MTERERDLTKESASIGKISSRRVYTGRVVSLDVDVVRFPNGMEGELEMIRHSGASAVVPLLEGPDGETEVILIKQYRYAAEGYVYEVPAGRLDEGEAPDACAHRELKEETGYTAAVMKPMTTIFTTPGFTDEKIHLFLATGLVPGEACLESDEVLDLHLVPMKQALEMIRSGAIQDGKTISALLFAARFAEVE